MVQHGPECPSEDTDVFKHLFVKKHIEKQVEIDEHIKKREDEISEEMIRE